MKDFHAFTVKHNGISQRILIPVRILPAFDPQDPPHPLPNAYETPALWDTGATNSMITPKTAETLGLIPVGIAEINHAGGCSQVSAYLVNLILPNGVGVPGVQVSVCVAPVTDFGAIIGMDIIAGGDMSITNVAGQTWMSFRTPSIQAIDYVSEANRLKFAGTARNAPCPCGKQGSDGKAVKYKNCHGKNRP